MTKPFRCLAIAVALGLLAMPAAAQSPPAEWREAAIALFARLDQVPSPAGTVVQAQAPGPEVRAGYLLARKWRLHNNGNTENILAEYFTFVQLCRRPGCAGEAIGGKGYVTWAQEVKAERARFGSADALVQAIHAWLERIAPAAGEDAQRNLALFRADVDGAAADFATTNIYALGWLVSRSLPDPTAQAASFARFGLFVHGKAWIGGRCLDISRIASVLDAPPLIATCK